ncbi:hypothetical protein LshimejAT787_0110480 [Lyophyllum shimeji]|uniref:Uncharacterized protein n=1 Tax=Lyophyllum shimeji TaxID=47721 RepID=A0A9P3UHK5_LYOSH|nr:hypothetical protein LshimejAT787_0110480 [Lyophyllum shimeji]
MSTAARYLKETMRSYDQETCPDYEAAVSRSNSNATTASTNVHWPSSEESVAPLSITHHKRERYVYTYNLLADATPLQFMISVEPASGKPSAGNCTFRLSVKANGIERVICDPTVLKLFVDPRHLDFVVFIFPGKPSIPVGSRWSVRVWLRVHGVDHRLFAQDELWVGKDLDFHSIADASFLRLKKFDSKAQIYHGFVGRALVTFTCRWYRLDENLYKYSLDYEANGVGGNLFEDLRLRIDGDPRTVTFLIYTVPIKSVPAGASHRVGVWLKSLINLSANTPTALPFPDSYVYQRIWKSDAFKIGAGLDFESMSPKATMGFAAGPPQTIVTCARVTPPSTPLPRRMLDEKAQRGYQ